MIDELLKMHGINYVISVDDCYSNPRETDVKGVLSSEMNNSFLDFRQAIEKMGKKDRLDDIEQMMEISSEKSALINSFLEEFSLEQLLELYQLVPQVQDDKYTSERKQLNGFLNMLKEKGYVNKCETYASTKDALNFDYLEKAKESESILWLIDRNFERVGESPEAGLELAKTIVGRDSGPTNYVYILSSLEEDVDKSEEDIESEFDSIMQGACDEKTTSFIYYLYKQRIMPEKPERIAKGLAQGFKRKACYELFDLYLESLYESMMDSSKHIREIRQSTLNYLFDEMVRENSESYLEFLTRFVNIFQLDSYQQALANNNATIVQKLYYYKQLCAIADDKVRDKTYATEKVKVFREIELYNKYVNKQHLEITTGDIFRIGDAYYFLASQPCDTCLRGDGTRTLDNASLLLICDDSSRPQFSYKLSCFHTYTAPIVKYQSQLSFPFEILDLCVQNENGEAILSLDTLSDNKKMDLKYYTERYALRMKQVVPIIHNAFSNCSLLDKFFSNNEQMDFERVKEAYEQNRMTKPELLKYNVESGLLRYNVQRICRLNELISIDIVNMFGINLSRIGHAFDFTQRTIRNS